MLHLYLCVQTGKPRPSGPLLLAAGLQGDRGGGADRLQLGGVRAELLLPQPALLQHGGPVHPALVHPVVLLPALLPARRPAREVHPIIVPVQYNIQFCTR